MKLALKLSITKAILLVALIVVAAYEYYTYSLYRATMIDAAEQQRLTSAATTRLSELHAERSQRLMAYRFRPFAAHIRSLEELDAESDKIIDRLSIYLSDTANGREILKSYRESREKMAVVQAKFVSAFSAESISKEEVEQTFEEWFVHERFTYARLADILGYTTVRELKATAAISELTRQGRKGLAAILLMAVATILISQVYFHLRLVNPIKRLTVALRRFGQGDFDHKIEFESNDEIGELTKDFNEMSRRLKEATEELVRSNEKLKSFSSVAAHDLRSPLATMHGLVSLLQEEFESKENQETKDLVNRLANMIDRAISQVDSLLAFSRAAHRELEYEAIDSNEVMREVLEDTQSLIEKEHGQVVVGRLPQVWADRAQFRELFLNLIGNALKYHKPEMPPVVEVTSKKIEKDGHPYYEFLIQDNGIGIDEKFRDQIFQPFKRLKTDGHYEGSGVGLAVCKQIALRHRGDISVESQPGVGTRFHVQLPAEAPQKIRPLSGV